MKGNVIVLNATVNMAMSKNVEIVVSSGLHGGNTINSTAKLAN